MLNQMEDGVSGFDDINVITLRHDLVLSKEQMRIGRPGKEQFKAVHNNRSKDNLRHPFVTHQQYQLAGKVAFADEC